MIVKIIYPTLNFPFGGGEYLALATIEALKELGFEIKLFTLDKINWNEIYERYVIDKTKLHEIKVIPFTLPYKNRYFSFISSLMHCGNPFFNQPLKNSELAISFDLNALADLNYVYTPLSLTSKHFWFPFYEIFVRNFKLFHAKRGRLIFLSNYVQKSYNKLGFRGRILYPPIKSNESLGVHEKEDLIITISRITPFKKLEHLLPVARMLSRYKFVIVGSLQNIHYYDFLKRHLPKNLEILPDLPEKKKRLLLRKAKFYIHLARYEPFSISVLEAMQFGAVPLVHRSGGPWEDIVYYGKYGLGYDYLSEIVKLVNDIDRKTEMLYNLMGLAVKRANDFSFDKFKERLRMLITNTLNK